MGGLERFDMGYIDPGIIIEAIDRASSVDYLLRMMEDMDVDETLWEGRRMYYGRRIESKMFSLALRNRK